MSIATAEIDRLRDYVAQADDSFGFEVHGSQTVGAATVHTLRLTSQTWRGIVWEHRLSVLAPDNLKHPGTAVLVIGGSSNNRIDRDVDLNRAEARIAVQIASQTGCVVAVLEQVPNQPLFNGLSEDHLIAHTFAEYLRTGEEDWPLLLPMVKSAVSAMDALEAFLADQGGAAPESFILTGGSKRGWTTWLTAAADDRVTAIVPMVFDILNLQPQLDRQLASYGGYSEMIRPYEERDLFEKLRTEPGATLSRLIDPYTYRDHYEMPKLIFLGTNDPYWTVDASRLYFQDLPGPKHLFYAANAGHSLNLTIAPTLLTFLKSVLADEPLPSLDWTKMRDGAIEARWDAGAGAEVWVWRARSETRDFREAQWSGAPLENLANGRARLDPRGADDAWTAQYLEVRFRLDNGLPFHACTEIFVTSPKNGR